MDEIKNLGLDYINAHRAATSHPLFTELTETQIRAHLKVIEGNAPYGNDPWPNDVFVEE